MPPRAPSLACVAFLALAACESPAPPAPAAPGAPSVGAPEPAASSAASAAPTPTPEQQRPLDLASFCPHDLRLYYGDNPSDGTGVHATISQGAALQVPRNPDGSVVVWVVDEKGQGMASVHVTKRMKHVRINTDCARIDAN
jgi:hypothetical protein